MRAGRETGSFLSGRVLHHTCTTRRCASEMVDLVSSSPAVVYRGMDSGAWEASWRKPR